MPVRSRRPGRRPSRSRNLFQPLTWPVAPVIVAAFAWPVDAARAQQTTPLAEVVNSATRTDRRRDEVPATVTVKTAADAQAGGARDLKDLFRNEADLSVRAASPRFGAALGTSGRAGNEGINIRGLEGNQVLLLVDGIRLPGSFTFGAFATGRLDTLAVDSMQTAEVLRGPASTQYGSDGLAGALVLRTAEASDLLKPGQNRAGYVRFGGATVDKSVLASVANAWRGEGWDTLLMASVRSGHEVDTQGENEAPDARRTAPNPVDYRQTSVLAKLGWLPWGATQRFGLTLETVQRRVDTDVISARTAPPTPPAVLPGTAVLDLDARDRSERHRISLQHRYDDLNAPWLQKINTQIYAQDAKMRQFSAEDRNTAADRTRDNTYREQLLGASTQAEANFSTPFAQRVSGGLEWSRNRITAVRDGTVAPFGETFPSKPFPDTRYTLLGAHLQDEIQTGSVAWIPALRWDHFRLAPSTDGYTGEAVTLSDDAITPRLGVVWKALPELALYGQASRGFRAPTPDQVNNGFTNVASGYRSIGNPNLKAERARSVELGLRGQAGPLAWQVAGYDNRYADFISQQQVSGSFTPTDPAIFQYINLAAARIRGAEVRATWQAAPGLQLQAAAARAVGDSEQDGVSSPLLSIEPSKLAVGARWELGNWSARADALHTRAKPSSRIAPPAPPAAPLFAPGAATTLDLGVGWKAAPGITLHAAIDNVFDRTYWRWSDVRGVAANSAVLDAFTAPGRSATLSARFDF